MSKYDIAAWAYENNLISEKDKMECYRDLLRQRNFINISCLNGIYEEMQKYGEENNGYLNSIEEIERNPEEDCFSPNYSIRPEIEGVYENNFFLIFYDSQNISKSEVSTVGNYLCSVREQLIKWGFNTPFLSNSKYSFYLESEKSDKGYAGVTVTKQVNGNVCSSYTTIYNYSKLTSSIKSVIIHELFHAVQNIYNYYYNWFGEASASFVALVANNDGYYNSSIKEFVNNFHTASLSTLPSIKGYGALLFPLTVYMDFGGMNTIRKIYEELNKHSADIDFREFREVINAGMSSNGYSNGFNTAYRKMAYYVIKMNDSSFGYGKEIYNSKYLTNKDIPNSIIVSSETKTSGNANKLTSQYYRIILPANYKGNVIIAISSTTSGCYSQILYQRGNVIETKLNNSLSAYASYAAVGIDSNVSEFILVVSNMSDSSSMYYNISIELS